MSELPMGWGYTPLNNLIVHCLGGDWGKECSEQQYGFEKVKVIRGTDFKKWNNERAKHAAERCIKKTSLDSRQLIEGDLVVEISGGGPTQPVGRTILIDKKAIESSDNPLVCSNFFRQVRIHEQLDSAYVNYALSYLYSKGAFDEHQTQTTNLRNLNFTAFLEKVEIPLAPLNEQRRIVEKLEKILGKVEAARERLERVPLILKRFRQSVLAAACSGKLTADWREENQDIETASKLVTRLNLKKKTDYENECVIAKQNKGRKPRPTHHSNFAPLIEVSDDIPNKWCITRIGDVSECLDYRRIPINKDERLKRQGSIPYYGANGQVGWIDEAIFNEDLILIVEDETFVGREKPFSYVIKGESWVNNHAHVLKPNNSISVEYLNICFSYYNFTPLTSGTTGRRKLNQEALLEAKFMFAPLAEQIEIVRRVEELFTLADTIEERYRKAKRHFDKLTQSVLAKAFRGELVPQDPNDEPASFLLERIKQERANNEKPKQEKKRTPSLPFR